MTINTGEYFRVSLRVTTSAGDQVNVYHGKTILDAPMSDTDFLTAVASAFSTKYGSLNSYFANEVVPADIRVDQVSWGGSPLEEQIIRNVGTTTWVGTFAPSGSGDFLPPGVAAHVKWRTSAIKCIGRKFLYTITEASRNGGGWSSAFATALAAFAGSILDDVTLGSGKSMELGLWSKRANAWVNFISFVVDTRAAYQRRRKERVGS